MAQRRMFSQRIVGEEKFLEMPQSAQNLYFHLGIYADDDGFINPQKIVRMIGANPDDLKILVAKQFVIPFEAGVVVITNWKENNYIQKDRYTPTIYQNELKKLECIQDVYKLDTQVRIGKDRLGEDSIGKVKKTLSKDNELRPEKKEPNLEINNLILLLKEKMGLSVLDGTIAENRRYCWLAIKKFKKEGIEAIIEVAAADDFWRNKLTSFKGLYYKGVQIASKLKEQPKTLIL